MKTISRIIATLFIALAPVFFSGQTTHNNAFNNYRATANTIGGNSPITGGILILLSLGMGYSAKKVYDFRKRLSE